MSFLDASVAAHCHSLEFEASPRRRETGRELRRLVDALYGESHDFDEWRGTIVHAASEAFGGQARLEFCPHPVDFDASGSSEEVRFVGHLGGCLAIVLSVRCNRTARFGARSNPLFDEMLLHLENGVRLRYHEPKIRGFLSSDGEILDRPSTDLASGLPTPSLDRLWTDLVEGRATLAKTSARVPRYVVLESPAAWHQRRALTETEARVVTLVVEGHTGKALAHSLGRSASTVSHALRRAASKIGLRTPSELVRLAAGFATEQPKYADGTSLTAAERDVVTLIRAGLSNQAIAQIRGRALRTIANQVASILRKTACPSRRALAAMRVRYSLPH